MNPLDWAILGLSAVTNVGAFVLMGVDKWKSKRGAWRVSEATLLLWCACLGAPGGWLGMQTFRHKTQHRKFTVAVPLMLVLQIALATVYVVRWR